MPHTSISKKPRPKTSTRNSKVREINNTFRIYHAGAAQAAQASQLAMYTAFARGHGREENDRGMGEQEVGASDSMHPVRKLVRYYRPGKFILLFIAALRSGSIIYMLLSRDIHIYIYIYI